MRRELRRGNRWALSGRREGPVGKESRMHEWQSLSHVKWECEDHVVIVPKYRKKLLFGKLRKQIGPIPREPCRQKGVELIEGHVMPDHVHMCLSIPPKYSVAFVLRAS